MPLPNDDGSDPQKRPVRLPSGTKLSHFRVLLLMASFVSGGMLLLAMLQLISGDGFAVWLKALLIAAGGTIVTYGVNRLAIERGAPLATIGYRSAAAAAVLSILFVGSGMWTATYSGMVLPSVSQLRLETHGNALHEVVATRIQNSSQGTRIAPAMSAVVSDLRAKGDCEVRNSCISGSAGNGRGPVARMLEERLGRAEAIANQITAGGTARTEIAGRLEAMLSRYQATASSSELRLEDKWARLRALDGQIRQALGELTEAMPQALAAAYAADLAGGVEIAGRPDASRQLGSILQSHGAALRGVIGSIGQSAANPPPFPSQAGVGDALSYIPHFVPIAAITAVVELVFPLVLWIYIYLALLWGAHQNEPAEARRPHEDDEDLIRLFGDLKRPRRKPEPPTHDELPPPRRPRGNGHYGPNGRA